MRSERHQIVKRIFLEACGRDPALRNEYVRQACDGDESIEREVLALLEHHTETTIIPSSPLVDTDRRRSKNSHPSRSRWSRGTVSRTLSIWAEELGTAGQLALGAAAMMVVVFVLAWWSQREVDRLNRRYWEDRLVKSSNTASEVVEQWKASQIHAVQAMQALPTFRLALNQVVFVAPQPGAALPAVPPDLKRQFEKYAGADAVYFVVNKRKSIVALGGTEAMQAGVQSALATLEPEMSRVLQGEPAVLLPHRCRLLAGEDWFGRREPMVGVMVPVVDAAMQTIGVVFVASASRLESLNHTLDSFRTQQTGEAFLASTDGRMLNESRFRDDLVRAGILSESAKTSVLMSLHDPGVDMASGGRPSLPYGANNPPAPIAGIRSGTDGVNVDGFRDYRGVRVIGAWKVEPKNGYGLVVKLDHDEAYAAMQPARWFFYARVTAILVALALVLRAWRSAAAARKRLKDAVHIGSYVVEGLLGEGGMGRVYKARHVLLKRSTAVKVIKPELVNERTIAWFEREVELAGKLKHPNTVEIYDFGRAADGQFYCAMEFLNGLNLSQVSLMEGALPAERVIHIMRQAAHSLREAHRRGMIHRDVKPQNIMLCVLGGEVDVVKVLDFGLAKRHEPSEQPTADTKMLAGTPLYLAPERLRAPYAADVRSDIYSLGLTVYKLLTGRDVFSGGSDLEVFHQMLHAPVSEPQSISPHPIPKEFSKLVMRCLAKEPQDRPQSMREVIDVLDTSFLEHPWRQEDARRWWQLNADRVRELAPYWDDEELDWDAPTIPPPAGATVDPAPAGRNGDAPEG